MPAKLTQLQIPCKLTFDEASPTLDAFLTAEDDLLFESSCQPA